MTETWPRCQDLTISGHDLSHPEVRGGRAALNTAEMRSDGLGFRSALWKVLGAFLFRCFCAIYIFFFLISWNLSKVIFIQSIFLKDNLIYIFLSNIMEPFQGR